MVTTGSDTINPAGSPHVVDKSPAPSPPSPDVTAKQDPAHTEPEFLRDLERASTNQAKCSRP